MIGNNDNDNAAKSTTPTGTPPSKKNLLSPTSPKAKTTPLKDPQEKNEKRTIKRIQKRLRQTVKRRIKNQQKSKQVVVV